MLLITNKEYKSKFPNPILLRRGEKVRLGKRDTEWEGWIYAYAVETKLEGWVPEQYIKEEGEYGILLHPYAAKELSVRRRETVIGFQRLNGWIWCRNMNGETGWLPENVFEIVDEER